ncbi:nucleoside triphosphate pyrophosphohydrolase [candidate division KSB1 bacterium]
MKEFDRLVEVMRKVQKECPWDKKQTHGSIRQYLIEETFEVIDAIDENDDDSLLEELGDVQCQVLFHSILAEQRNKFNLEDVLKNNTDKMVRRHPHIFGDVNVKDSDEVLTNWENIKMSEGKKKSVLDGVPKTMPALIKAYRTQSKAARVGFDWEDPKDVLNKISEEFEELKQSVKSGDKEEIENELGDLLFSIVNYARKLEVNPEDSLRRTIRKFRKRFQFIEKTLKERGTDINDSNLAEMDNLWNKSKERFK